MPNLVRPAIAGILLACLSGPATVRGQNGTTSETLTFGVEWRFIRAGTVNLTWKGTSEANMVLRSEGLVSRLYRIEDDYISRYRAGFCVIETSLDAKEGKRHHLTKVKFDSERKKANFLETDVLKDSVVLTKEVDIPSCVHDVIGGLRRLRSMTLEPGQAFEIPVSDGKKTVNARMEVQKRETIKTPLGTFPALRLEAFLFNGVLYGRKGRLYVWVTDDNKRLPIQLRVQLPFYIGTVDVQLEKIGTN